MVLEWHASEPPVRYRNPEVDFQLNTLERFYAEDNGLKTEKLDEVWRIVLIELSDGFGGPPNMTIHELERLAVKEKVAEHLFVPKEYSHDQRTDSSIRFVTVFARRPYLNAANVEPEGERKLGVQAISLGGRIDEQTLDFRAIPATLDDPPISVPDGTVVTAVIDNGIAVGNSLFCRNHGNEPKKSRVEFFWNMAGRPDPDGLIPATIGRKWRKVDHVDPANKDNRLYIDSLLEENFHGGLLDEPAFYRDIGLIDWTLDQFHPCAQRVSHGTHVMGLSSGYDPDDAAGDNRPIIAVNLPTPDVEQTSGSKLTDALDLALNYILERHAKFHIEDSTTKPPLVVNFSFGNYAGPHDGTSLIERAIDKAMSVQTGDGGFARTAILPVGNGNLARCHARFKLTYLDPAGSVDWRVQPGDRSESIVQFWTPKGSSFPSDAVTITVIPPGAVNSAVLDCTPDADDHELKLNGKVVGTFSYRPPIAPTNRGTFRLQAVPSAHFGDTAPYAPSGPWRIVLALGAGMAEFKIKSWVVRDETLPGFPESGRQSYFDVSSYQRFKSPKRPKNQFDKAANGGELSYDPPGRQLVRRTGTISGFACGDKPAVIAGFVRSDRHVARYSATGPSSNPDRKGPDAAAVTDDTNVLSGVLSAGSGSGSRVAMRGTSVAAPQVARWVATLMGNDLPADRAAVRHEAALGDPPDPKKPPVKRIGGGRLDLPNVYGSLRWRRY